MIVALVILTTTLGTTPPVPGMCTAPASENVGKPGCFLSTELDVTGETRPVFWTIHEFRDRAHAEAAARRHSRAVVVDAHARIWLYVIAAQRVPIAGGTRRAVIGPLQMPAGRVTARFMESTFPPGMRTRVHAHAGPEAFYVVDGEQCMESPGAKRRIGPGGTYVVAGGPHVQAAPRGRRNLVLILSPAAAPWMTLSTDWTASDYCN